jgi:hypothetical protein
MGNQRRFERHLRPVSDLTENGHGPGKSPGKSPEAREGIELEDPGEQAAEDAELMENLMDDWFDLTDELVASLADQIDAAIENDGEDEVPAPEDSEGEEDFLEQGLDTIVERYGLEGIVMGSVLASRYLVEHILAHGETVTGIEDALEMMPPLSVQRLRNEALSLAEAVVAEAGGVRECSLRAATKLGKKKPEDALTIALSVWQAFCFLGSTHAIGISWCDEEDLDDLDDQLESYPEDYLLEEDDYLEDEHQED